MTEHLSQRRVLVVFATLLCLVALVDLVNVLRITNNHDFAVYYVAAQRLRQGEDIFAEMDAFRAQLEQGVSTKNEETPWPYAYPPFLAVSVAPLSFLPSAWASAVWTALCLCALAISCALALHSQRWLTLSGFAIVVLLLYQFQPAVVALRLGQMDIMIFLLISLAFWLLKRGNDGWAGLALGLAIGIKLFAGFLVIYLLWKRRWRAAVVGALSGAVLAMGSFALVGLDGLKRFLVFSAIYTSGDFAGYPYHQSLNAFFTRSFKANMFSPPVADLPWLATTLTVAASALILAGFFRLTRRPLRPDDQRFDLEYALAVVTLLLVVPPAPRYSFVWLLLAFIIVAARLARGRGSWLLVGLFALSYVLAARLVYFPVPYLRRLVVDGQFMLSALVLWAVIAWLLMRPLGVKGDI